MIKLASLRSTVKSGNRLRISVSAPVSVRGQIIVVVVLTTSIVVIIIIVVVVLTASIVVVVPVGGVSVLPANSVSVSASLVVIPRRQSGIPVESAAQKVVSVVVVICA